MITKRAEARGQTLVYIRDIWNTAKFGDQRFGQFIVNLFDFTGEDPWGILDEEWPDIIRQFGERAGEPGTYRGEVVYDASLSTDTDNTE